MSPASPSSRLLFLEWFLLGLQSFGGGSSLLLIHRIIVERHAWITDEAFTRNWALSQLCPGINLIAFTLLCGRQIAGVRGMALCLLGLLLPSAGITLLLTAIYTSVRETRIAMRALDAILPASVGLGLLSAATMLREPLRQSRSEGVGSLFFSLLVLAASGVLALLTRLPVFAVLLGAGGAMALAALGKKTRHLPEAPQ